MKKRYGNYIVVVMIILTVAGCALVEPKVDEAGKTYTDLENYMKMTGGLLQQFGLLVPGWGTVVAGLGGMLSIIAGSITSVSMVRKRGKTLDTVIRGVNEASIVYDEAVRTLLSELKVKMEPEKYAEYESKILKMTSIKDIIKKIADQIGTQNFLHARVKRIG